MERGLKSLQEGIKVAVITGGHMYDVPAFRALFNRMAGVQYYIQDFDNWAFDTGKVWDQYDVHLFYNMHSWGILTVRDNADEQIMGAVERLGQTEQGVVVLHHALLSHPDGQVWSDICNIQGRKLRGWAPNSTLVTDVANKEHPITKDLETWQMTDELFLMDSPAEGSVPLLTTENPESIRTLAWAHQYNKARVFCYQSGHDNQTYTDPNFQTVLHRGIQWAAGKI